MVMRGRIVVTVLTVGLAAAAVRADMTPIYGSDIGPRPLVRACSQTHSPQADILGLGSTLPGDDLGVQPIACSPNAPSNSGASAKTLTGLALGDDQGSFGLCLYALLGLGVCRSAPWLKKLHFGVIPDWYHTSGPFQIGHSHVIGPDCLCSAAAVCFVQPQDTAQDFLPQYYWRTIASLLRTSLFRPNVLASRGPPLDC